MLNEHNAPKYHQVFRVLLPSAIMGLGLASAAVGFLTAGIMMMAAGIAIVAFDKACQGLDLEHIPVPVKKRNPRL